MKAEEFRRVRLKFDMSQDQFADLLALSGNKAVSNIETGFRNPSQLAANFLRVLDTLPRRKAEELIEMMLKQGKK